MPVPLDNVEHALLRVRDGWTPDASINQALIVPAEFEQVQREYPILFRRDNGGKFQAVAILGLDRGENLFLGEGGWDARYVPATLRRGPFLLAGDGSGDDTDRPILIDLDDSRISDSDGEPLFLPHGGAAPLLQRTTDALRTLDRGLNASRAMFAMFIELELIAPVEIDVDLGDGTHYRLADFFTVSDEALASTGGAALEKLNRAGFLAAAIHARSSLANVNRLIELKTRKLAGCACG